MGRRWGHRSSETASAPVTPEDASIAAECADPLHAARGLGQCEAATATRRIGPLKVRWVEKGGFRREATLRLDDPIPEVESEAAAEYRLRIKASFFRKQGMSKEQIAKELGRAPGWVTLWWDKLPAAVPRPREVPPYVADYNLRMWDCGVEPFRPAVLRRRYMTDTVGLYEECAQQMPWRQAVFRKRNYETGEVTVTNIASSRQDCSYRGLQTGIARLDKALDRIRREFDIADPRAYLLNNFYPDGNTSIAPHQHDFWSAILSFGASRVFTVDGQPTLLGDGDLLVFGTQRHGVPKMPDVTGGRVSVAIFWQPENKGAALPDGMTCAQCGRRCDLLQESEDGNMYCEECWRSWQGHAVAGFTSDMIDSDTEVAEDDLIAAVLQISRNDY